MAKNSIFLVEVIKAEHIFYRVQSSVFGAEGLEKKPKGILIGQTTSNNSVYNQNFEKQNFLYFNFQWLYT